MPDDIAKWLEDLGLGEYAATFADNAIDAACNVQTAVIGIL